MHFTESRSSRLVLGVQAFKLGNGKEREHDETRIVIKYLSFICEAEEAAEEPPSSENLMLSTHCRIWMGGVSSPVGFLSQLYRA